MPKMNFTKIIRVKRVAKPKVGYNSLWLIQCNVCGELMLRWDTDMYNKNCPICKNEANLYISSKETIKENIFRIQRRLYSEYRANNILTSKEVGLLSSFRTTEFKSILDALISDYWFLPKENSKQRKKEWMIDTRGKKLINNPDFLDLLKECYMLLLSIQQTNK
jgi:phage FluMu protein Com